MSSMLKTAYDTGDEDAIDETFSLTEHLVQTAGFCKHAPPCGSVDDPDINIETTTEDVSAPGSPAI